MASIRLNTWMKDTIVERLEKQGFDDFDKAIKADFIKLANDLYNKVYSKKIQDLMATLPAGALPEDDDLKIRFEGTGNSGSYTFISWGTHDKRRIFRKHESNVALVLAFDDPLTKRYIELTKRQDEYQTKRDHARRSARNLLDTVTTVKKLCEVWPEVAPFCADFAPNERSSLPALPIKDLNAQFGLPPKKGDKK